jgi:hypothetical protein
MEHLALGRGLGSMRRSHNAEREIDEFSPWEMHVLDERSPLNGYDAARAVKANAQVFVTIEARDPTLATTVHDIRNYPAEDIRFGMRYTEAVTTARDGTPVLDLTTIGALEPDIGDRQEQGWTDREENV